ncbi:MAG: hypothetical protein ACYDIC_06905 [Desulfobaccales bacterium]
MTPKRALALMILSTAWLLGMTLACQAITFNWVGGNGNWSVAANWSCGRSGTPGPPGPADQAVIPSGSVHLDVSPRVAALTVNPDGQVFIEDGTTLEAPVINNDGLITVGRGGGGDNPGSLGSGQTSMTLTGSGVVLLTGYIGSGSGSGILTHGASHTIRGGGFIGMPVQNYGRIIADQALTLIRSCFGSSDSVLAASGAAGTLYLWGGYDGSDNESPWFSGQILPQDGKVILFSGNFSNVYFGPGQINTIDMRVIFYEGITVAPGAQITVNYQLNIFASSGNSVSITNNGTINSPAICTPNIVTFTGTGTISGGDFIGIGGNGSFINDIGHTIQINGGLHCDLNNYGTLIAVMLGLTDGRVLGTGSVRVVDQGILGFFSNSNAPLLQAGDFSMDSRSQLIWDWDGTIDLKKNFSFRMTEPCAFSTSLEGYGNFQMSGGGATRQLLEVGGRDYGLSGTCYGWAGNFNLPKLSLAGAGTYVSLVDNIDNGQRFNNSKEALYLGGWSGTSLSVPPGTTLNLNRLHLYAFLNGQMHQVRAGEGNLFGGGQIIDRPLVPPKLIPIFPMLLSN